MLLWWAVVLVMMIVTVDTSRLERQAFSCDPGKSCSPLSSCDDFRNIQGSPSAVTSLSIRRALCNRDRRNPMVCCARAILTPVIQPTRPTGPVTVTVTAMPPPGPRCSPGEQCVPISICPAFQSFLEQPTPALINSIRQATCERFSGSHKVCCPGSFGGPIPVSPPTNPTLTTVATPPLRPGSGEALLPLKCKTGRFRSESDGETTRFRSEVPDYGPFRASEAVFAIPVKLHEDFSWMAVLGYISMTDPFWGCGGALIAEQYVLTAAHCVHTAHTNGHALTVVRLGELNLETEIDCKDDICAPPPQDFTPAEIIMHPDFDTRAQVSDDIALIRLDRKVKLSIGFVEPLCLPPAGVALEGLLTDGQAEAAGWGLTETGQTSTTLQKVILPFVNKATCNPLYDNLLLPEQLCFGGGMQDSCKGDSGGPLVARGFNNIMIGIVSRGRDSRCGVEGIPAVYTHVAAYRTWITNNIRP